MKLVRAIGARAAGGRGEVGDAKDHARLDPSGGGVVVWRRGARLWLCRPPRSLFGLSCCERRSDDRARLFGASRGAARHEPEPEPEAETETEAHTTLHTHRSLGDHLAGGPDLPRHLIARRDNLAVHVGSRALGRASTAIAAARGGEGDGGGPPWSFFRPEEATPSSRDRPRFLPANDVRSRRVHHSVFSRARRVRSHDITTQKSGAVPRRATLSSPSVPAQ